MLYFPFEVFTPYLRRAFPASRGTKSHAIILAATMATETTAVASATAAAPATATATATTTATAAVANGYKRHTYLYIYHRNLKLVRAADYAHAVVFCEDRESLV